MLNRHMNGNDNCDDDEEDDDKNIQCSIFVMMRMKMMKKIYSVVSLSGDDKNIVYFYICHNDTEDVDPK